MDEIAEIDKEVRALRKRILELNKRRIEVKKLTNAAAPQRDAPLELSHLYNIPIRATKLRKYTSNLLRYVCIETIGELTQRTRREIRNIRGLGEHGFAEIENMMLTLGVNFKGEK